MERKEQGTVQALERGLKILELLMLYGPPGLAGKAADGRQRDCKMPGYHAVGGVPDLKDAGDKRLEFPDVRRQIHSGREVILCHGEK